MLKFRCFKLTIRTGGNGSSGAFFAIPMSGLINKIWPELTRIFSISISKKLLSKSRPKEFAYVSHFQWAVFIIFLLFDYFDLHQLSTLTKLIGMALWFVYIFLVIRLRYRFNQNKLEDHCHLMALLYSCCCPCSYGQMGAELLEKKSAIITVWKIRNKKRSNAQKDANRNQKMRSLEV